MVVAEASWMVRLLFEFFGTFRAVSATADVQQVQQSMLPADIQPLARGLEGFFAALVGAALVGWVLHRGEPGSRRACTLLTPDTACSNLFGRDPGQAALLAVSCSFSRRQNGAGASWPRLGGVQLCPCLT